MGKVDRGRTSDHFKTETAHFILMMIMITTVMTMTKNVLFGTTQMSFHCSRTEHGNGALADYEESC